MKTFIQKAMEGLPNSKAEFIINRNCPYQYGLEKTSKCSTSFDECEICWNRTFPEPVEAIPRFRHSHGDIEISNDNGYTWNYLTCTHENITTVISKVLSAVGAKYTIETYKGEITHEGESLR